MHAFYNSGIKVTSTRLFTLPIILAHFSHLLFSKYASEIYHASTRPIQYQALVEYKKNNYSYSYQ